MAAKKKSTNDQLSKLAKTVLEQAEELLTAAKTFNEEQSNDAVKALELHLNFTKAAIDNAAKFMEKESSSPQANAPRSLVPGSAPPENESTFSTFLSQLGKSVVDSQQELDRRSIEYLSNIQDRPFIPPTLFRLPKLSAELKVGMEQTASKGINVFLFSKESEVNEFNHQSLTVDITAVPPSPELLELLHDKTPRINFLFDSIERKEVFEALGALASKQTKNSLKEQLKQLSAPDKQDQVLIWPIGSDGKYLILFAGEDSANDVGILFLDRSKSENVLEFVMRLDLKEKPSENQNPLRKIVLDLGLKQKHFLRGTLQV